MPAGSTSAEEPEQIGEAVEVGRDLRGDFPARFREADDAALGAAATFGHVVAAAAACSPGRDQSESNPSVASMR